MEIVKGKRKPKKAARTKSSRPDTFRFDYVDSIENPEVVDIKPTQKLFINGKFVQPKSGKYIKTINPATGKALSNVACANKEDIDLAVKAARKAYDNVWSKMPGRQRARYIYRISRIFETRKKEFVVLETLDNGKPIKESRNVDIPLVAAHFFHTAGWADKLEYAVPGQKVKPVGVCGQIIPWNFPLLMAAWKIAPALAAGNTVVIKPSINTSLTLLMLAEVIQQADLPPGVVNVVTGSGSITGTRIVNHPGIDKIAFTGSTEIGKGLARAVANTNKKLTLELGGKSPMIVYEDAAIDQAIEGVVSAIFFNQGHVCCAGSRLLLEESIEKIFIKKLKRRMKQLRVGNPLDKNTDIGAINSLQQLKTIKELVKIAKSEGCIYYEPPNIKLPKTGFFHAPCIFTNVGQGSTINQTEVFGPVLAVTTFRTPEEAIKRANDTTYGLAASVWSEKATKLHKTARALKAGIVWTNTYNKFDPASPFGGYKESGMGREGGLHGLYPYLEVVK